MIWTPLFSVKNLKGYFVSLLALVLVVSLLLIFIPSNFPGYLLSLSLTPKNTGSQLELADIEIKLKYPEYTNLYSEEITGSGGHVKAIKGTEVTFQAKPLSNFKSGNLKIENGVSVPVKNKVIKL